MTVTLKEIVNRNRAGEPLALPSFCTANTHVLTDIVNFAAENKVPVLIEATCNQVNQYGGYTGQKPSDYAAMLRKLASDTDLPDEALILGGDHLGPNPWKNLPASEAMQRAKVLVKDFVEAGFTKIHLDASMACGGEAVPSFELVASRSAELCLVAETYAPDPANLSYVIGTEVPVPGGEADDMSAIEVTSPDRLNETIQTHIEAFKQLGVSQGIDKAIAVVVQPGVDFSHDNIFHYDRAGAQELTRGIQRFDGLAFEAHSTDYQSTANLAHLAADHSIILKVGPELTFRFREGVLALDQIESELDFPNHASVRSEVLNAMHADPSDWDNYYQGSNELIEYLKLYSFSDRIRYYWDRPAVKSALTQLMENLSLSGIPSAKASQFGADFPIASKNVPPTQLTTDRVTTTISRYYQAGGWL